MGIFRLVFDPLLFFYKISLSLFVSTICIGIVSSNLATQIRSSNRTERDRENKAVTKTIVDSLNTSVKETL